MAFSISPAFAWCTVLLAVIVVLQNVTVDAYPGESGLYFKENFETCTHGDLDKAPDGKSWWREAADTKWYVKSEENRGNFLVMEVKENVDSFLVVPFKPDGNSFFGRMFVRVYKYPATEDLTPWILTQATCSSSSLTLSPIGGQYLKKHNDNYMGVSSSGGPTGDWIGTQLSAPLKDNEWRCFTFSVQNANSEVHVAVNGNEKPDLRIAANYHPGKQVPLEFPAWDKFKFGMRIFREPNIEKRRIYVHLDDLALSRTPLSCDNL